MAQDLIKPRDLTAELMWLFDLKSNINTVLAAGMYTLSQFLNTEKSSIFLADQSTMRLYSFSSLDLEKREICLPKSSGVAGWVFEHFQPAIVNTPYEDIRFDDRADRMTGFRTRNLICAPLTDHRGSRLGTIQSLNKKNGNFTVGDLDRLCLIAPLVAVAIKNCRYFNEIKTTNDVRGKAIKQIVSTFDNLPHNLPMKQ